MATTSKSPSVKLMKNPGKAQAASSVEDQDEDQSEQEPMEPEQAEPAPVTKASPKPKQKVKAAEPEEVTDEDLIVKTVHEIETMKASKAFGLVPQLLDNIDHDYFRLGGVLASIQANGWFMDKGHETFRAFVESECGLPYRKSMYFIEIYNGLVESGVSWDQVKHLGWTKLSKLANILSTENVGEWVQVADSLTVLQLVAHIAASTKGENSTNSPEKVEKVSDITTMTFKLHTDQKTTIREALDKAKHETGTEFDAVALEAMALDFLGGESKLKSIPSLKEMMTGKSAEEVLETFGEVFPEITLEATLP